MDTRILWVWLSLKFAPGKTRIAELLERFGTIEEIYNEKSYKGLYFLTYNEILSLKDKSLDAAQAICMQAARKNIHILVYEDKKFPQSLKNIKNPVYVLYFKGRIPKWENIFTVGVIGTRKPSEYGVRVTRKMSAELAEGGAVIVSGMARGLDSVAAWSAVKSGMFSIGVIGSGADRIYPPENIELFKETERNGLILSEYPPGTPPNGFHFPLRNRIISGLSNGVLVTEAPIKSGTRITAADALENGRDVFAVPGSIFDMNSVGTNSLLQQGAKCVWKAEDIFNEYPYSEKLLHPPSSFKPEQDKIFYMETYEPLDKSKPKKTVEKTVIKEEIHKTEKSEDNIEIQLSETEKTVLNHLSDEAQYLDEIIRSSGLLANSVTSALVMLELYGKVKVLPGNKYLLK